MRTSADSQTCSGQPSTTIWVNGGRRRLTAAPGRSVPPEVAALGASGDEPMVALTVASASPSTGLLGVWRESRNASDDQSIDDYLPLDREGRHLAGLLELAPTDSGMQVAAWLADGVDDCAVAEAGRRAGLALRPLSPYWLGPGARPGLHLGYAAVPEGAMEPAVLQLARVIDRPRVNR